MTGGAGRVQVNWCCQLRRGALSFVPLVSESSPSVAAAPSGSPEAAVVTVELHGARVEVRGTPGLAVLSDVFVALRRTRSC